MKFTITKPNRALSPLGLLILLALSTNLYIISFHVSEDIEQGTAHQRKLQEEEEGKPWPKPDGWEKLGFYDTRKHFKCKAYAHDQTKPLPSMKELFIILVTRLENVSAYVQKYADASLTLNDPVLPTKGYSHGKLGSPPPYYAAHSADGRGRGLFASRDIKKGELVHDGGPGDVIYPDEMSWRRFIFNLPRNKACDMIDWTWTQQMEEGGDYRVFTSLNISILMNTGNGHSNNISPKSSFCDRKARYDSRVGGETCSSKLYAIRDIKRGEELLMDYKWYPTVWHKVGLGNGPKNERRH